VRCTRWEEEKDRKKEVKEIGNDKCDVMTNKERNKKT